MKPLDPKVYEALLKAEKLKRHLKEH